MAAVKYIVNTINVNHTGQCYQIRNQKMEFERTSPANFRRTFHKCVPTTAVYSQKQAEANNMNIYNIYDTKMIFSGTMAQQTKL